MNNANDLTLRAAAMGLEGLEGFDEGASISKGSWLTSQNKLEQLHELRVMALSNAKIIYGSEKFKHYGRIISPDHHVVIAFSEPERKFAAILVCIWNEASKILRKEVAACPLAAARAIVYGLQVDTGLLMSKYNVGDQLFGQQGGTPREGMFELYTWKHTVSDARQDQDDTASLLRGNFQAPTGPRTDRYSYKRPRCETDKGDYWDRDSDSRGSDGRLRYDD